MIKFEELAFKQAKTYCTDKLITIPLAKQGAVYIGGCNSSGKSLPFNVFHNILFGYTPLSARGKRKLIANTGYYGHVKLQVDNTPFQVKQFFNNKELGDGYDILERGKSLEIAGGTLECERYIANLLPFTPDEFCGFYYLSQDNLHVLAHGKGSERLAYLSKVFGFDIYDKIRTQLKFKLDDVDAQLAEVLRAQEDVDILQNKLRIYPSAELLSKRAALYAHYLQQAQQEKTQLEDIRRGIESNLNDLTHKESLEESISNYGSSRECNVVEKEVTDLQQNKIKLETCVRDWTAKEKFLKEYAAVKVYVDKDEAALSTALDEKIQKKGQAFANNNDVVRREDLKLRVAAYTEKLKEEPVKLIQLKDEVQNSLASLRASQKDRQAQLKELSTLKADGGSCTRCGQKLDSTHIAAEVVKLTKEIATIKKTVQEKQLLKEQYDKQVTYLDSLNEVSTALKTITYKGKKIDIVSLSAEISTLKNDLKHTGEAKRLKKEILKYIVKKPDYLKAINSLGKIETELEVLRKELDSVKEKNALKTQLAKLPKVVKNRKELKLELEKAKERLQVLDDAIPGIASDEKEALTMSTIVLDYTTQLETKKVLATQVEEIVARRKIINACYKAYAPSNLKKDEVTKISNLIAEKLNIFVPLIFNEQISFTTSPSENSVDILFKRGNQEPQDVKFLSGGYKKRFLIALIPTLAGLVSAKKQSNLIILDEIDANVDSAGREAIGEFLVPYLKQCFETVIVISPSSYDESGQLQAPIPLEHFDRIHLAEYKNGRSTLNLNVER